MKICYLSDAGSPHTHKWANYFHQQGHEIVVISLGDGDCPNAKVHSLHIEGFRTLSDFQKLKTYGSQIQKVRQIIKKEKPDILHAHYATSYGTLASCANVHPYLLSVWGADVYDFPKRGFLQRKLIEYNLKKSDIILSTSHDMKRITNQYTNKEIIVTPFGVDTDKYRPMEVDRVSEFTVGTIKSFYPKYGITYLIEGFKKFIDQVGNPSLKLLLGGKGSQEGELRALVKKLDIEDNVIFLGFLNQEGVIRHFNQMDVAVFASTLDSESFGVAAVEAQSCECATIVSNVGGLPEATKPGYSSIVIDKKNSDQICEALVELYSDREKLERMKKNAREYVLEEYKIEENFAEVSKLYEKYIIQW